MSVVSLQGEMRLFDDFFAFFAHQRLCLLGVDCHVSEINALFRRLMRMRRRLFVAGYILELARVSLVRCDGLRSFDRVSGF
jgi:hypothetical protein